MITVKNRKDPQLITFNTETDVQIINGWKARSENSSAKKYYRLYELAGVSHIPATLFPLKLVGIRPVEMAEQGLLGKGNRNRSHACSYPFWF